MSVEDRDQNNKEPVIRCESVYMIFGDNAKSMLEQSNGEVDAAKFQHAFGVVAKNHVNRFTANDRFFVVLIPVFYGHIDSPLRVKLPQLAQCPKLACHAEKTPLPCKNDRGVRLYKSLGRNDLITCLLWSRPSRCFRYRPATFSQRLCDPSCRCQPVLPWYQSAQW